MDCGVLCKCKETSVLHRSPTELKLMKSKSLLLPFGPCKEGDII
jgi:hypothetical protein